MIKKTTLFVLLAAVLLGAAVYYFDWKRGEKEKAIGAADDTKPAFAISSGADITSIMLSRPAIGGEPAIHLEKRDGAWKIVAPIQTDASEQVVKRIADGIATARVSQTEPGTPDRLKVYGLETPAMNIEFQTQNGSKHSLKLGDKDFTGVSVYAIVDGAKDVALLPQSLLTTTVTTVEGLRDHSVLEFSATDVASFELKNPAGELSLVKNKDGWKFRKPANGEADSHDVNSLLTSVASASFESIASETPQNLGKYGLTSPSITFTVVNEKGKAGTLLVGRKDGSDYFARDASRPMIFRIDGKIFKDLTQNYAALRDKSLIHFEANDVNRLEFHDSNVTAILNRKTDKVDEWAVEAPADLKTKPGTAWRLFSALTTARADDLLDHPGAEIAAKLVKPAVEVTLTEKSGKKLTVEISKESGDFVYGRTSDGPAVYKMKKQVLEQLNLKADDFTL
ncbi:MAG: DUF4340 domain-containing protein [Candidatus Acidiferrales bacterium]